MRVTCVTWYNIDLLVRSVNVFLIYPQDMSQWKDMVGRGGVFTLSYSVSRLTLSPCHWHGNPFGSHSTGGGIYQTALATHQTLAASVKQLPYHFISSAADNSVTMQIAAKNIHYGYFTRWLLLPAQGYIFIRASCTFYNPVTSWWKIAGSIPDVDFFLLT